MAAIYQADIWCDDCAELIRQEIINSGTAPADPDDEGSYDSDEFPKYADDDEETDSPQHCASGCDCVNAVELPSGMKLGSLIGTSLTINGEAYTRELINNGGEVAEYWREQFDWIDFGDDDTDCDDEPCDEDYVISPCGHLGSRTNAGQINGAHLGEFDSDDEAIRAIVDKMEQEQFWPNIWNCSDHGNMSLVPQEWIAEARK